MPIGCLKNYICLLSLQIGHDDSKLHLQRRFTTKSDNVPHDV